MRARWSGILLVILLASVVGSGIVVRSATNAPRPAYGPQALWGSISPSPPAGWGFTQASTANPGPQITVIPGESVTLDLSSADLNTHTFWVDYNGNNNTAGEPQSPPFNTAAPIVYTFSATPTPGKYWYKCGFHGYFMEGRFIVQGASNLPPTIAITNPTGAGGDWTGGSHHTLSWTMSDPDNPVATLSVWLNYSYNGGANRGTIAGPLTGLASPASFDWTVPLIDATDVTVSAEIYDPSRARGADSKAIPIVDSTPPTVIAVIPPDGATNVAVTSPVIVNFSEPMTLASVALSFIPPVGGLSYVWSNGDRTATIGHAVDFLPLTRYTATIGGGAIDASNPGNPLNGGAPFSWNFTTEAGPPHIIAISPDGSSPVPPNAPIVIDFDQAIDWVGHPFLYTVTPDPGGRVATWSNGNQTVTITHTDFANCTTYTVGVTNAQNAAGRNLQPGPVPNPWTFTTNCPSPYVVSTIPADGATGVGTGLPIWVNFSKSMNPVTVSVASIPPTGLAYTWSNANQTLELTHATAFLQCTSYNMNVQGRDTAGLGLVAGPVPNPWTFDTNCPSPYIVSTDPPDGATNVSATFSITITFSASMDFNTVTVTITPPITGPTIRTWSGGDTILIVTLTQAQAECTSYSVLVQGNGTGGSLVGGPVPNPWSFTTVCPSPYVASTTPVDGATSVRRSTNLVIAFNEAMNTASVGVSFSPAVSTACVWTGGNTICLLPVSLLESTWYFVNVTGSDVGGMPLVSGPVPYHPFHFKSNDLPTVNIQSPNIATCISGGAVLSIQWTMSDPETPTASLLTWINYSRAATMSPITPGPITNRPAPATYPWTTPSNQGDFDAQIWMDVVDSAMEGGQANSAVVHVDATPPTVASATPTDSATNVPTDAVVQITFSEPMDRAATGTSSVIFFNPAVSGLNYTWSNGDRTVTVGHSLFAPAAQYNLFTSANAKDACSPGTPMSAPQVVQFFTGAGPRRPSPPMNAQVSSASTITISLTWNAPTTWTDGTALPEPSIQSYRVYRSSYVTGTPQFVGSVPAKLFTDAALSPDTTYYYWVTAVASAIESDYNTVVAARTSVPPDGTPPIIQHTPPSGLIHVGDSIVITATVTDPDDAVAVVKLAYVDSAGGEHNVTMTLQGGVYTFSIPSQRTPGTVRYRIYAEDTAGNKKVTADFTIDVQPAPTAPPADSTVLLIVGAVVAVTVALVALVLFLGRRRKRGEEGGGTEPPARSK